MPISEIINALLLTFIATEYSIASSFKRNGFSIQTFFFSRTNQVVLVMVVFINMLERFFLATLKGMLESLLHTPKILLASLLYLSVLYVDCARLLYAAHNNMSAPTNHNNNASSSLLSSPNTYRTTTQILAPKQFLQGVGKEFLKILPLYPFLAVLISFGFMIVISFCEHLHLPLNWLNWPIYYGTLYGPFSLVYFQVKKNIVHDVSFGLPS